MLVGSNLKARCRDKSLSARLFYGILFVPTGTYYGTFLFRRPSITLEAAVHKCILPSVQK